MTPACPIKIYLPKNASKKKFNIFLISSHKHILWYSLEAPHLGTHNHIFVEKWSEALLMSTEMCPKVLLMNTQYLHFCREIKWGTFIEYHNIWFCGEKGTIFIWRPLLSGAMITIILDKALFFLPKKYIFLIFWQKHMLWVLIRSASPRRFEWEPTTYVFVKK